MKTSKAYYNRFRKEFVRFATELGLTHYRWDFVCGPLKDNNAQISTHGNGKIAIITVADKDIDRNRTAEELARHEVFHLLLADFSNLADWRHAQQEELVEEEERIVHRLEKLFL